MGRAGRLAIHLTDSVRLYPIAAVRAVIKRCERAPGCGRLYALYKYNFNHSFIHNVDAEPYLKVVLLLLLFFNIAKHIIVGRLII